MTVRAPLFVSWMSTRRCNLRCEHCYIGVTGPDDRRGEASTDQGRQLIDQLAAADVCLLSFGGAEPLLRDDVFELAAYARGLGLTVVTCTNGICVTDDTVSHLRNAGFGSLQISLDGSSAEIHERLRGRGSFAGAITAIERCARGGLPITIAIAVHRSNVEDVPRIVELAKRVGATHVKLQPVLEPGHRLSGPTGGLSAREAMDVCDVVERALEGSGVAFSLSSWAFYGRRLARSRTALDAVSCSADFDTAIVFEDGSVGVCEGEPGIGSAFDGGFLESWEAAVRRKKQTSACACAPFIRAAARAAA